MGGAGAAIAFLLLVLQPSDGAAAAFAATYLALVAAACCGPFLDRWGWASFALGTLLVCGVAAPLPALWGGLFAALLAATAASVAGALRVDLLRPVLSGLLLALLATFFYWDDAFLLDASNPRASAAWAFALNPAAAASVTLGFDWMHAKALYTNNVTAESMFNVPMAGMGPYALKLLAVLAPAAAIAFWRERRAA